MPTGVKYGGRKKGTPNKISNDRRNDLRDLVNENIDRLRLELEKIVDPNDFVRAMVRLMEFTYPKLQSTTFTAEKSSASLKSELEAMAEEEEDE